MENHFSILENPMNSMKRQYFLYSGQEATVRTGHGTTDWFQIGKGTCQGCILSPCLFNLYAIYKEHTLRVKTKIESKEIKSYALQTKHKNAAMTFLMS